MIKLMHVFSLDLATPAHTQALGECIADYLKTTGATGFKLYLQGDLGAGKSTLTRAILRRLGVTGTLRSPSYALLEPYEAVLSSGGTLHHFDFYRLDASPLAWREAGFADAFEAPHAAVVEWPQYAQGLPAPDVEIVLSVLDVLDLGLAAQNNLHDSDSDSNAEPQAQPRSAVCSISSEHPALLAALKKLQA